jgi:CheY-like chemotaxis protein
MVTRCMREFETLVVSDLEQARMTAQTLSPQVMVVDSTCVDLSPSEVAQAVREWGLTQIPIIQCPLPGEKRLGQELGVEGYLIKPVSSRSVWNTVRRFGERVDTVLIVDDDLDFVRFMSRILEDNPVRRYKTIGVRGGQEALDMAELHQPDLIFLDLVLPDLDGFQVVERLHTNPAWRDIPIVIVSAKDSLDGQTPLAGALTVTKPVGLKPVEVLQWARTLADAVVTPAPASAEPREAPPV